MDTRRFTENRLNFPSEELEKYAGRFVAWSPDGTRIVASAEDERSIDQAIRTAGHDPAKVLVSFVPHPDEVVLGGGGEFA